MSQSEVIGGHRVVCQRRQAAQLENTRELVYTIKSTNSAYIDRLSRCINLSALLFQHIATGCYAATCDGKTDPPYCVVRGRIFTDRFNAASDVLTTRAVVENTKALEIRDESDPWLIGGTPHSVSD